jgi:leader peptidase (prepilin peptidase)/N-methyltransferase
MVWVAVQLLLGAGVVLWAASLTWIDIRQRRLPNVLTLPGGAVILVAATAAGQGGPALLGAFGLTFIYLLVHLVVPAAMGAGDVKLAIGTGALTGSFGVPVWALAAIGAPVLTGVIGVVMALYSRKKSIPHGPSMCLASLAAAGLALI